MKELSLSFNDTYAELMDKFILNWFSSQINSLIVNLSAAPKTESDKLSCLSSLNIIKGKAFLVSWKFKNSKQFATIFKYLLGVDYIEFNKCAFDQEPETESILLDDLKIKNVTFKSCNFADTMIFKNVIIDSDMVKGLTKVSFMECKLNEDFKKMIENCEKEKQLNNFEIKDK